MLNYRINRFSLLTLTIVLLLGQIQAQVRRGRLANGLSYILRRQTAVKHKAEYRLVMRVGSCHEEENERGLAHFLEHSFFSGNRQMSAKDLETFFNSCGIRIGFGYNAFTSQDRTVYSFSLPSEIGIIAKLNRYVKDNLQGFLSLQEQDIELEKSIIKEELRARQENDIFYSEKIGIGLHSRRMPLGTVEEINAISSDKLRKFLKKWYKPNLTTIIIVGDINLNALEQNIKSIFSDLQGQAQQFKEPSLAYHRGLRLYKTSDELLSFAKLELIFPHQVEQQNSLLALYHSALRYMALKLWSRYLYPINGVNLSNSWYLSDSYHLVLDIEDNKSEKLKSKIQKSLSALTSLEQKTSIAPALLRELITEAKQHYSLLSPELSSLEFCNYYIDEIIHGDKPLENKEETEELHQMLDKLTWGELQGELNKFKQLIARKQGLITYLAPKQEGKYAITKTTIEASIEQGLRDSSYTYEARAEEVKKKESVVSPKLLSKVLPYYDEGVEVKEIKSLNLQDIRLRNGLRLVLKKTEDRDSLVRVSVIAQGGLASIPLGLEKELESVAGYLELGGVELIERSLLENYMFDRTMSIALANTSYYNSIMGSSKAKDLGEFLALIREKMLRPERAIKDFEEVKTEMIQRAGQTNRLAQMIRRDKTLQVQRYLDSLMGTEIMLPSAESKEEIERLNFDMMYNAHVKTYSSPSNLTILVVGSFDFEPVKQRLISLFQSLSLQDKLKLVRGFLPKSMPKSYKLSKSSGPGHETTLFNLYYAPYSPSLKAHLMLKLCRELIRSRMITLLREKTGLVYSPYMYLEYRNLPEPLAYFKLETTLAEKNVNQANSIIKDFVNELRTKEVSQQELEEIKKLFLMNKQEALTKENTAQWQTTLINSITKGESLEDFANYELILSDISPKDIQRFLKNFLSEERRLICII